MKKAQAYLTTTTRHNLSDRLKTIVENELAVLPATLAGLNNKDRLDAVLKLMQLVVPKPTPVHYREGGSGSV